MSLTRRLRVFTFVAATLSFAACDSSPSGPSNGDLRVEISGLPTGALAAVTVAGPNGFARTVAASETISELPFARLRQRRELRRCVTESDGEPVFRGRHGDRGIREFAIGVVAECDGPTLRCGR